MMNSHGFTHLEQQPVGGSKRVFVLLHGTGGDENSLIPLAQSLDPNAGWLAVRGKVLEHGAPRFFRRLAEGVFDMEDLRIRTAELAQFIEAKSTDLGWSATDLTALGYSNGANIAASILLSGSAPFSQAILLRAMVPFEPEAPTRLSGVRTIISSGKSDPIVPVEQPERLHSLLSASGVESTLVWQPTDHRLIRGDLDAVVQWLSRS